MIEGRIALTESERMAILRQRFDIFVEEFNFLPPREDGQRIESDQYDEYSLLLGVWEGDELIGSCRLVLPNNPLGFPALNTLVIDSTKLPADQLTGEVSRITVAAGHRTFKKSVLAIQAMQREIHRYSAVHGITQWVGAVEPSFMRLINCASVPCNPIGPLQHHIGPDRYPVIMPIRNDAGYLKGFV